MDIELTTEQVSVARRVAYSRASRPHSVKYDENKTEFDAHYIGILGEIAVAQALKIPPPKLDTRNGGDNGVDLSVGPLTISVKTRTKSFHQFACIRPDASDFVCHVGVLAIASVRKGNGATVSVVGWTTIVHAMMTGVVKNFNYGDRLVVPKLMKLDKLIELIDKANTLSYHSDSNNLL